MTRKYLAEWRGSRFAFCLATALALLALSCAEKPVDDDNGVTHVPLTIQMQRDVEVRLDSASPQLRGILYGDTSLMIRKGERIEMQWIGQEGGCRVLYKFEQLELSSCPWLPGFTDHQSDIFEIIDRE